MSNYPNLLERSVQSVDSSRGLMPAMVAKQIFTALVEIETSIADAETFCRCELGQFAERGVHEKVRKDLRNFQLPVQSQAHLFPDLDFRYTVPHADGGERQIEHARMTRDEWLMAEAHLRTKAIETLHKAEALEDIRKTFDHVWRADPALCAEEAYSKAFARRSEKLGVSGLNESRLIEQETV